MNRVSKFFDQVVCSGHEDKIWSVAPQNEQVVGGEVEEEGGEREGGGADE
jgi:hypothetical protein